ncbi:ATP-binding protein [Streptomyces sp. NBC_01077]|uniref:ATP-binding protein n=1 Tax=Streptomyces sp. NBC_01077 TaxID=2903746 RepID=UPI003870C7D7|nr:ATP-binding protein [Streptomyces sp. NBC_01077]
MSIWWSLHLRREAASVPLARRLLMGTMETAGVDPDVSYELSVALTEACANAVEHGGGGGGESGAAGRAYRVTAYLDGETCRIEVADSGPGFPGPDAGARGAGPTSALPGALPGAELPLAPADAEHGRGLRLIEELADHVHFGNRSGRGGAVVSFDKILKWKDSPSLLMA